MRYFRYPPCGEDKIRRPLFEFLPTSIDGCYEVRPRILTDHRGTFSKLFHYNTFRDKGLLYNFSDADYLISSRDAIRGLHFHPENETYALLVSCVSGSVLDVVVDLRRQSQTYKKVLSVTLEASVGNALYIPAGLAHGYLSVADDTALITLASRDGSAGERKGIHWKSIDFNWPVSNPVVSDEDDRLMPLADYVSQF